jgi:hypothetical protein
VPRERSAAVLTRAPAGPVHEIVGEILNWRHEYALVAALLGPPCSGKTALLEKASEAARLRKFYVQYVDLSEARELRETDAFYRWLVRKLKEDWWREVAEAGPLRLTFCSMLGRALVQRRQPVLLALDHVEALPEVFAYHLISDLREIQQQSEAGGEWGRLRCVVAGCVSVYELRRRVNSPNLQFKLHTLPAAEQAEAEELTRRHLLDLGVSADGPAIHLLAHQTGGESAFLAALNSHLPGPRIDRDGAETAVALLLRNACQYRHLSQPACLYLLDQAFRDKADRLLDGSPVALPGPGTDIDRYQLAGAWITAGKSHQQPRFRNGLVERVIRGVRAYPGDGAVDHNLQEVARQRRFALGADEIPRLLECTETAWHALSGLDGRIQLLVCNRETAFAVDGTSVSPVDLPEPADVEGNGHQAHSVAVRVEGEWAIDTHWPVSNETVVVRVRPDKAFSASVAAREMLRLWSLFLQPLEKVCLGLALQTLGRHALRTGLSAPKKVFVSSTYLDLLEHREVILEQLVRRDLLFRGMEFFGAEPANFPPSEKIVREVRDADVYLGIFGVRYGSVDPKSGLSMTELEFNEAEASGKPMLLYVIREDASVKASYFDAATEAQRKLLLTRVKKHTVYQFGTVEELARQVYEDLGKL